MKTKIFLMAFSAFIFTHCSSQKTTNDIKMPITKSETVNSTYPSGKPEKNVIRLVEKQNVFSDILKMNLTFLRTVEDNRCPMNARCATAGSATVELEIMGLYSRPQKILLSTEENKKKNILRSFVFNKKKITLANIYPANSTDVDFKELKGKYVIDIKIE